MNRYPTSDEVLAALGDKVVAGFGRAVAGAREDLAGYRAALPDVVADHSCRGLANWIHDRMWAHAVAALDGIHNVSCVDLGPSRDIYIGLEFHIRLKRHSPTGAIRNYPTATALEFITQEPDLLTLLGIRTLNLCVGYEWDDLLRSMGAAVISLRDGSFDEVIWMTNLPEESVAGDGIVTPIVPTGDGPAAPVIDVPRVDRQSQEGTSES